jgi:hypothetical protein
VVDARNTSVRVRRWIGPEIDLIQPPPFSAPAVQLEDANRWPNPLPIAAQTVEASRSPGGDAMLAAVIRAEAIEAMPLVPGLKEVLVGVR